jgi:hypothetical protein
VSRNPARLGKADATQPEMVEWLESHGFLVQDLHQMGDGCPDLLVGAPWGELLLVECKTPSGGLTRQQAEWHFRWRQFHGLRCMPRSVVELRAWMERRKKQWLER